MSNPLPPSATDLVEVQTTQAANLSDRLALLNEVVAKRQEEADSLQHTLVQTQAQITLLTHQSEQARARESAKFQAWLQEQKDAIAMEQNDTSKSHRIAQESLQRIQAFEEESRLRLIELNSKEAEFKALAQDRLDTAKLRQQAEAKMQEAQTLFGQAQEQANQGSAKLEQARRIEVACEARNLQMQNAWNANAAKSEELRLRERDVEIREKALNGQLLKEQLTKEPVPAHPVPEALEAVLT